MRNQAEASLSALIESTEDHIWSVGLDGRVIFFNRAFQCHIEQHFGVQVAEGMDPQDIFPPERAAVWPAFFERARKEGPFRVEHVLVNGQVLEMAFNPIIVHGETTGVSVFGKDISERKAAEESLRESGDSLREAQRIGKLGCYVLDVPSATWTSSKEMDEIFGIGKDYDRTVPGWVSLIHPDDRAMMAVYFGDEVIGKREGFDKEYRIIRHVDRAERWVQGMGRLEFDALGHPTKVRGVIKDITERKRAEMLLRDNEERYRETFEQAAVGILHTSLEGRILRCNGRFAEIIGYSLEEACGLTFQQITPPEDLDQSIGVLKRMLSESSITSSWEKRYVRKDGSLTWIKLTVSTRRDSDGRALHFISVVEDINDRKIAEERLTAATEALRASEARYRTAFQTSPDAIAINHLSDGRYIEVNDGFVNIAGFPREELVGHTALELGVWADPCDRLKMTEALRVTSVCRNLEAKFRKKDGTVLWGLMSASVIEIEGGLCALSVTRDITEAKAAEEQIRELAFYDPLTCLPNRRLLLERSRQPLATNTPAGSRRALLTVDLDDFKTLNETLGHANGDLMLQEVARRLVACIREPNTLARLGADEFVVMLEGLSQNPEEAAAQAEAASEKILAVVGQPYLLAQRECRSTASIGITVFEARSNRINDRLQQADIAMDQAKAAGGNTIRFFAPALQAAVNARVAMAEELREAINDRQFILHFQPQVDYGQWIGAEALIRWNHPRRGLIFPDGFIPMAEETGLILPIGNWVLETACAQIALWAKRSETAELAVSINISARQLRQPGFVDQVLTTLERTGADPHRLELELTESMLVDDIEGVIAKMSVLKSHGLRFSLDDFGTGYSSLTYLKRLPLDRLKIDRSFVRDILVDDSSGAIAQTIISLSQAMGLPVIAEGVETEKQREFLVNLGCNAFQGYLFSRPVPVEELELLLQGFVRDGVPAFRGA
jgi:diguanylate cyclase (GGDEF)-like protein/PAS domain S-box-containing protein